MVCTKHIILPHNSLLKHHQKAGLKEPAFLFSGIHKIEFSFFIKNLTNFLGMIL